MTFESCFNLFFTAIPIIWFACFDWEHDKEKFLTNPKFYKIGLLDVFFDYGAFARWFFYAFA
jgi:magnesium-transporting ATPase (P-type)